MIKMNLRKLMFDKEVNQTKVAKDTGISTTVMSNYYNNNFNRINKNDIEKLCKYFNCTLDELFTLSED